MRTAFYMPGLVGVASRDRWGAVQITTGNGEVIEFDLVREIRERARDGMVIHGVQQTATLLRELANDLDAMAYAWKGTRSHD